MLNHCKTAKAVGVVLCFIGVILVLCCIPVWLWLAVLGLLVAALGICLCMC